MHGRISDPTHLLGAVRIALAQGGRFLTSRIAPGGPILDERNLSYLHKTSWGMYATGVDHDTIGQLLDWAESEALQPNGDFYFPEERPEYKDFQRVYRTLNFGRIAAYIDHPLIRQDRVIDRILQYQHEPSGGVFHFIGDDPREPGWPESIGTLSTTFFGQLMIALGNRDQALAAGRWVLDWVQSNRPHMDEGVLYCQRTPDGSLITDVPIGQRMGRMVDLTHPKQEFWNVGTSMAYLCDLYDVMRNDWGYSEDQAQPYLDAAMILLDFESHMPLDTYLWPSKCKVGWGVGELMRVLVQHGLGTPTILETTYRIAERVAIFTFLDNQLPHGGWPCMHYPLDERVPEIALSYKPLKHTVAVPPRWIKDSRTIFLSGEEITGEFLGEMKAIEEGISSWLEDAG